MKISSLIPDVQEDSFGDDRIVNYMLIRMAEKIDYLEALVKGQKEDIAEHEHIRAIIMKKLEISEDSVFLGSFLKWDPDYKKIRNYFGGAEE